VPISFDRVADEYDESRGYPDNIMETIINALEKTLAKDGVVLDAGTGTGRFAKPLQDRGYNIIGIDVSSRMLRKARDKGVHRLVKADMCTLPFQDQVFDTALSIHVMHLIRTWKCALAEIGRVTRSDFVSVDFKREDSPAEDFRRLYEQVCRENGHELRHPGLRERELIEVFPPDMTRKITAHEHIVDVKSFLEQYEDRVFSNQWDVPDEIHETAMEALRKAYEGVEDIMGKESVMLILWKAERVREFASGETFLKK